MSETIAGQHSESPPASGPIAYSPNATTAEAAIAYVEAGLLPIPIPHAEKGPVMGGWPDLRLTTDTVSTYFDGGASTSNVGVLLGASGIVDVDLDTPEAVALAPFVLPETATFGRPSNPSSHRIYRVPERRETAQFKAPGPDGPVTLVEYRDTAKSGASHQTVFPPSTHPTGETVSWDGGTVLAEVDADALLESVKLLAFLVVVLRLWPREQGGRHEIAGALGTVLTRAGRDARDIKRIVYAIAEAAGDEEPGDRANFAGQTAGAIAEGRATTGAPTLVRLMARSETDRKAVEKALGWIDIKAGEGAPRTDGRLSESGNVKGSVVSQIIRLSEGGVIEPWRTPDGEPHVTVKATWSDGHREHHSVRSKAAAAVLRRVYFEASGRSPKAGDITEALEHFEAEALFGPNVHESATRVALADMDGSPRVYLDLSNDSGEVVEVRPGGWSVVPNDACPVRFVVYPGMLPLPHPAVGLPAGTMSGLLESLLNVRAADRPLISAWYLAGMRPVGELPVLALAGEQGTGKSWAATVVRSAIDPNKAPLRDVFRNAHEAFIQATNSYVLVFDNVSRITEVASDVMCRLSTGGGFAVRQMYSNSDEDIYQAKRLQIITGITDVVSRGDLAERTLGVTLQRIPSRERKPRALLESELHAAVPQLLGGLLDAAAYGLQRLPDVVLTERPRLGDLAEWVTACEPALGDEEGTFVRRFGESRREMVESAVEGDPVADAVRTYVGARMERDVGPFLGTAADLLEAIDAEAGYGPRGGGRRPSGWPSTPRALSGHVRRVAPMLREVGLSVEFDRRTPDRDRRRLIRIAVDA